MSTSVASDLEAPRPSHRAGTGKAAILAAKLLVTGACFWYISRHIDLNQVLSTIPLLDFRWAALAILVAMLEIPLAGLRWYNIVDSLGARDKQMTRIALVAATAVGVFLAQVLPSVAGEGVRAWLLVRLGSNWRTALTSVVIDRGVGVGLLIMLGFLVLLLPSGLGLTALGGYRDAMLLVYGALILAGALGLLLAPKIMSPLARWRYSRWFATLAADVHRVLLGSKGPVVLSIGCLIHAFTIVVIWLVGRAQGLALPLSDAVVLFMTSVVVVPISIGGWGLRELAVVSLLASYGVAPERALLFSVCFGLALAVGSLPGALAWLLYPFASARRSAQRTG